MEENLLCCKEPPPGCSACKHRNPCRASVSERQSTAWEAARRPLFLQQCDAQSSQGCMFGNLLITFNSIVASAAMGGSTNSGVGSAPASIKLTQYPFQIGSRTLGLGQIDLWTAHFPLLYPIFYRGKRLCGKEGSVHRCRPQAIPPDTSTHTAQIATIRFEISKIKIKQISSTLHRHGFAGCDVLY